jgi:hypothetical protein
MIIKATKITGMAIKRALKRLEDLSMVAPFRNGL